MEKTISLNSALGEFIYDKEYDQYSVDYNDGKQSFEISITVDGVESNDELITLLKKVETLVKSKYYESALLEMEEEMINLKNGAWLEDEEPEMTTDEFRKRITIKSITFYEDGSSEIFCDDDDIFWGHYILIGTNENGIFDDVSIAG